MATGIPSEEVITAARAEDSDLIVVGTRGKTGLAHVLLGSTDERVIRGAPCPVLAVRTESADNEDEGVLSRPVTLERILVPVDFSDRSLDALEYAVVVAQQAKASLMLLYVLEPVRMAWTLPSAISEHANKCARAGRSDWRSWHPPTSIPMCRWSPSCGAAFRPIQS